MEEEEEETPNEPRTTIGAQDILSLKTHSHSGVLRYEGSLERFVHRATIFKPIFREAVKWRQRFVVLCEGCMYIYKDEYSTSPMKALSLANYNSVRRIEGNEVDVRRQRMSFQLIPLNGAPVKYLKFCCISDEERKAWFQKIRKEMEEANNINSQLQSDFDQDEYVALEKPIHGESSENQYRKTEKQNIDKKKKKESKQSRKAPKKPLPPTPPNENDEEDPLDDYDTIDDDLFDKKRPLPDVPKYNKTTTGKSPENNKPKQPLLTGPIKPKPAPKPVVIKEKRFSRSEFEFNSNDRNKAEEILDDLSVGTFLVRKSRQDAQEVLAVKTEQGVKEYKIYKKERGYSIDNKELWFNTTEELLDFYADHEIPNRVLTLTRGFSTSEMHF